MMYDGQYTLVVEPWITAEERDRLLEKVDEELVIDFAINTHTDFISALLVLTKQNTLAEVQERNRLEEEAYIQLQQKLDAEGCRERTVVQRDGVYCITAYPLDNIAS